MNVKLMRLLVTCLAFLMPLAALAQGFAGLGTQADGFAIPDRSTVLRFPQDHGAHPQYRIEWWYLTANLRDDTGQAYGVQWTLFRSALRPDDTPGWKNGQLWMGHAALTTSDQHYVAERLARGGIGQAGVTAVPFSAWIDEWQMAGATLDNVSLRASGSEFSYDLSLQARGPLVLHGTHGYSVKSASGQASHYYSQPRYEITGTVTTPRGPVAVSGQGWFDREWSSQPLDQDQTGWDWFSLSLEDGNKLMGFRLRGQDSVFTSGTWIGADGTTVPLLPGQFQARPLNSVQTAGRSLATSWQVTVETRNLDLRIDALNPDAWMDTSFPYWEGPVQISGSHSGSGYLEMTGYE
ncbi:lipocalin-like domain-containing protein [Aliisedimentitalea scapharcae]|uniref:Lipocalin-like domain-containing protein n=1 Tax=Aliisedimentitalea scapharcae TaxID=1524259 RepID=A0ABZ2XNQ7_9RHOB